MPWRLQTSLTVMSPLAACAEDADDLGLGVSRLLQLRVSFVSRRP